MNMIEVNIAMKSIIFIWTVIPFVKSDAADLSWKPLEMREYHKQEYWNREPHLKSSYCPIRSRFQAISNSSFKCKKQDLDATNGMTIVNEVVLVKLDLLNCEVYFYLLMTYI